jgi:hypothetical protein
MKKTKPKKAAKKKVLRKSSVKKPTPKKKSGKAPVRQKSSSKQEKKSSFKPKSDKLAIIRQAFVTILWRHEALPPEKVRELLQNEVAHQFPTEFPEYFDHVNELLTKFRLIEEVPDKKPLHIRLAQRLEE